MPPIDRSDGDGAALRAAATGGAEACPSSPPIPAPFRPLVLGWRGKSDAEERWEEGK